VEEGGGERMCVALDRMHRKEMNEGRRASRVRRITE